MACDLYSADVDVDVVGASGQGARFAATLRRITEMLLNKLSA